ncbi:hypothetical protein G9F32_16545, partial [Acinetobacter sp. 194]|uniref:hypothetical protein n=1 Tax=Acinetobacter shaoyimingii TaxID=2715164 RepID=UPI001DD078C0|nr:hypothetical protein [Acinetobacter shaoyimingii]
GLKFNAEGGTSTGVKKLGEELSITGADTNISTTADSTGIKVKLSDNLQLSTNGSVKIGDTIFDNSGLQINNNLRFTSSGIEVGNQRIQKVAAAIDDTDAVNLAQLKSYVFDIDQIDVGQLQTHVLSGKNTTVTQGTGQNGQTEYTVNADGSKVSSGTGITVTHGAKDANNITDYTVALSDA